MCARVLSPPGNAAHCSSGRREAARPARVAGVDDGRDPLSGNRHLQGPLVPGLPEIEDGADGDGPKVLPRREVAHGHVDLDDRRGGQLVQPGDEGIGCRVVRPPDRLPAHPVTVEVPEAARIPSKIENGATTQKPQPLPSTPRERPRAAEEGNILRGENARVDLGGSRWSRTGRRAARPDVELGGRQRRRTDPWDILVKYSFEY